MGSGEGRENRPRSRHCDRRNAVSQDTFPSLWCWHSSRERVWRCAPFSRGAFLLAETGLMKFKTRPRASDSANAGCAKTRTAALRLWLALFSWLLFGIPALAQTQTANSTSGSQDAAPVSHSFTDEIGRKVEVPTVVKRIVSLAPNLTEIVFALGEGDHLAGDTDFCDYPTEATQKPRVGGPINPNLEQIVALAPDLVLATKAINRRETVEALARIGLPVFVTDPHSVDDMIASVEHIGNVLHAEKTAAPLVEPGSATPRKHRHHQRCDQSPGSAPGGRRRTIGPRVSSRFICAWRITRDPCVLRRGGMCVRPLTLKRLLWTCGALAVVLLACMVLALNLGAVPISVTELVLNLGRVAIGQSDQLPTE